MAKHTTVRIKEALLRRAKAYARDEELTLTAVMERALTSYLGAPGGRSRVAKPFKLPAFGRGGVRKGIELDDTSALLDLMDGVE